MRCDTRGGPAAPMLPSSISGAEVTRRSRGAHIRLSSAGVRAYLAPPCAYCQHCRSASPSDAIKLTKAGNQSAFLSRLLPPIKRLSQPPASAANSSRDDTTSPAPSALNCIVAAVWHSAEPVASAGLRLAASSVWVVLLLHAILAKRPRPVTSTGFGFRWVRWTAISGACF